MKNKFIQSSISLILILVMLLNVTSVFAFTKEETVYAKLQSDGIINNVIVSEHLQNYNGKTIVDRSVLDNIINTNGDEEYSQDGNKIVWETNGNDIYYQGTTNKALPISLTVKYYLDEKELDVNDMLGKSGKVKIVLTYTNNLKNIKYINGRNEVIYVPFAIVTTSLINNADNRNIKVTNGRVINNGLTSVVVAISSPGLYETLNINEIKDLNRVEISYETDNFALNSIYSVASSNMFEDFNIGIFDRINELYKNIDLLQANMDTIVDGSHKLKDGSKLINDGVTELNKKANELSSKYYSYRNQDPSQLKEKVKQLIIDNLKLIIPELKEELSNEISNIIKDNKEDIESSMIEFAKINTRLVIENEIDEIVNNLDTDSLIDEILNSNIIALISNDEYINNLTEGLKSELNSKIDVAVNNVMGFITDSLNIHKSQEEQENYINDIAVNYGITYEQAKDIVLKVQNDTVNSIKDNISSIDISKKIIDNLNNQDYIKNLVNHYIEETNKKITEFLNNYDAILNYANNLKEEIIRALKADIGNSYLSKYLDINKYVNSLIDQIIDNTAKDLADKYTEEYSNEAIENILNNEFSDENINSRLNIILDKYQVDIDDTINTLDETIQLLLDSFGKLNNGTYELSNGMSLLSEGLERYNKEGINKLSGIVDGDIKRMQGKIEALIKLGKEYKTLDDILPNTKGESKIIFMIDSLSKVNDTKVIKEKQIKNKSLWDKIKGLFK